MSLSRSWVCRSCWLPTTDGPICSRCAGSIDREGHRATYGTPAWRRLSARAVADHVARYGQKCLRCGSRTSPANPLTADHPHALANGGSLLGQLLEVMCRRCNSSKGAGRPTAGQRRRRRV